MVRSTFDSVADRYDDTRGGEPRGERYAEALHPMLGAADRPVLEVGVGTGVVSLGLQRRGRKVIGVDISSGMLARARQRLGPVVARADAIRLPLADGSMEQVISVWMVTTVYDPPGLFREVFRVLRPGGRYLVCPTNRPVLRDRLGLTVARLFRQIEELGGPSPTVAAFGVPDDVERIVGWGEAAGFRTDVQQLPDQEWPTSPEEEIAAIENRTWAALVDLDDETFERLARPTIGALAALPRDRDYVRRATASVVVLTKP